jgi:hypothetical protein
MEENMTYNEKVTAILKILEGENYHQIDQILKSANAWAMSQSILIPPSELLSHPKHDQN